MARKEHRRPPLAASGRRRTPRHLGVLDPFPADTPSQGTHDGFVRQLPGSQQEDGQSAGVLLAIGTLALFKTYDLDVFNKNICSFILIEDYGYLVTSRELLKLDTRSCS